jgi:hypothetical protein
MLELDTGALVDGSMIGATYDDVPSCSSDAPMSLFGVWYTVMGTGNQEVLTVCEETFSTSITITEGSCGELVCTFYDSDEGIPSCEYGGYQVVWSTVADIPYFVYVSTVVVS